MLLNLHIHLKEKIQLGNYTCATLLNPKHLLLSTFDLFKINLQPQPNQITDPYDIYDICTINSASYLGNLYLLDWWLKAHNESGLELKYDQKAIRYASHNGHVEILDWWLKAHQTNGLKLKYDEGSIAMASEGGHVEIMDWWLKAHHKFNLELKYNSDAIYWVCLNGHSKLLKWWKRSGLKIKHNQYTLNYATHYGLTEVLELLKNSGLEPGSC